MWIKDKDKDDDDNYDNHDGNEGLQRCQQNAARVITGKKKIGTTSP